MRKILLPVALLFLAAVPAHARMQGSGFSMSGTYSNKAAEAVIVKGMGEDDFYVGFGVGAPGCGGYVAGNASAISKTEMILRAIPDGNAKDQCTVKLTFTPDMKSVSTSEDTGSYFHGAQCDFTQTLAKKRK